MYRLRPRLRDDRLTSHIRKWPLLYVKGVLYLKQLHFQKVVKDVERDSKG
jgi:hypothetical protein